MALTETHDYDDIINLPHHQSRRHAHMALSGRAAQFMPFAAMRMCSIAWFVPTRRPLPRPIPRSTWRTATCLPDVGVTCRFCRKRWRHVGCAFGGSEGCAVGVLFRQRIGIVE